MLSYQRVWEKVYCETGILATKRKKPWMKDANSKAKKGATNLEAGLLIFELRPHFWVRDLALFWGSQNTNRSCSILAARTHAGTHASANASWQPHMSTIL